MYKVTITDVETGETLLDNVTQALTYSVLNDQGAECAFLANDGVSIIDFCKVAYGAHDCLNAIYEDKPEVRFVVEHLEQAGLVQSIDVGAIRRGLRNLRKHREEGVNDSE